MDFNALEKDQLKEYIKTTAELKGHELQKGWHLMKDENMVTLAEEIEALETPVIKEKGEAKIKGSKTMKEKILECPKVTVYVPEDQISKTNHVNIWINGVQFIYAREKEYEMPKPVADVYLNSLKEERKARKKMESFAEIK